MFDIQLHNDLKLFIFQPVERTSKKLMKTISNALLLGSFVVVSVGEIYA